MGLRITNNILTLRASNWLSQTSKAIARSLERLSSGQRITSARDDAAGLSSASRFLSQTRGMTQAIRNINEAQGYLETADSALQTQFDITNRMLELATSAANGTLSSTDRANMNLEFKQLYEEFQRITNQTEFNGTPLLNGSFGSKTIQVGFNRGESIRLTLDNMQASGLFTQSATTGDGTFQSRVTILAGSAPHSAIAVDVNGDNHLDILSADFSSNTVSVSIGNGNGTFGTRTTIAVGQGPNSVIAADLNGDHSVDVVTVDQTAGTMSIAIGNGNGTFQARFTVATGSNTYHLKPADVNGDGKLDILEADFSNATISIFLGNGNGTFLTRTTIATQSGPYSVATADVNSDGTLDIISADGTSTASIFIGNGNGTFQSRSTITMGATPHSVLAVDINGDSKIDIITADYTDNTVSIALGNGNGTFRTRTTIAVSGNPMYLNSGDFNGDGNLDLAFAELSGSGGGFALGNGDGTFKTRITLNMGSSLYSVVSGDVNEDGALDIIMPNASGITPLVSIAIGNSHSVTQDPEVSIGTQSSAETMIEVLGNVLSGISNARANVSAIHSRLEFSRDYAQTLVDNVSEAYSRTMDTDLALEVADLVKNQILQQAEIAALTQANLQAQLVLKLLEPLSKNS